jgi:hypothetical protein
MIKTTITLACGHGYAHVGIPTEAERLTGDNPEPKVQCRACGSPQKVVDARVDASR